MFEIGRLYKVVFKDFHAFSEGSIVKYAGQQGFSYAFELIEGDTLNELEWGNLFHDCEGLVPSGRGQWLKKHDIIPFDSSENIELYI